MLAMIPMRRSMSAVVSAQSLQSSQKLAQSAVITPRLQRALKLLQVPAMDLRTEIAFELAVNPVLEEADDDFRAESLSRDESPASEPDDFSDVHSGELTVSDNDFASLNRMAEDWRDSYYDEQRTQSFTAEDAERREHFLESHTGESSLHEKLLEQARDLAPAGPVRAALIALVAHLDERGYLTDDPRDIALTERLDAVAVDRALLLLRRMEPAGLGARDLRECLLWQLEAAGRENSIAARILTDCYADLLKRRFPEIAKKLSCSRGAVQEAVTEIGKLDAAPARRFAEETSHAVAPDVVAYRDEETGAWRVELTGDGVPRLRISRPYKELLAGGRLSAKDRAYLSEKIRDGRFLVDALAHRQNTVLAVANSLLKHQSGYFEQGRAGLRPLVMQTVAAELGVHETTVSRAVAGKWIRSPHGMMELRDFFSAGYATAEGGGVASAGVKEMIADIVAGEDSDDPLSDDAIADALEKKGVKVARRTVAKYREAIGIQPRYLRRRQV